MAEHLDVPLKHIEKGMVALKHHCQGKTREDIAAEMCVGRAPVHKYLTVAMSAIGATDEQHAREIVRMFSSPINS